jgi:hypothetical protein
MSNSNTQTKELTNFQMIREFKLKPEHFGILSGEEVEAIRTHFNIANRTNVELQNLRDFIVMFFSHEVASDDKRPTLEQTDLMSAITGVIDQEKVARGMEV